MPTFRVTGGVLTLADQGTNYPDNTLPGAPVYPDQGLPPGQGGIPSNPIVLPLPPPTVWPSPPPSATHPIVPAPPYVPPGVIWPPMYPARPDNTLPPSQARPDHGLPGDQPHPDQGLPGSQPRPDNTLPGGQGGDIYNPIYNTYWALCYTPQYGWRYISYDPSLTIGYPLPPYAQPKV